MRYPLKKLGLPGRDAQRLERAGVIDSDYLLARAATPELREQLAEDTGMPITELARWAGVADLVRIKGIGPVYAQQIVAAGLAGNVPQFLLALGVAPSDLHDGDYVRIANRPAVRHAAQQARKKLKDHLTTTGSSWAVPGISALAEAAEEAAEVRPRLVLRPPDASQSFRARVTQQARSEFLLSWHSSRKDFGAVYGILFLFFSGLLIYANVRLKLNMRQADALDLLESQIKLTLFNYLMLSFVVFFVALFAVLHLVYLVNLALDWVADTQVAFWLFDADGYRQFYRKVIDRDVGEFRLASKRIRFGLLGLLVGGLAYTLWICSRDPVYPFEQFLQQLTLPMMVILVPLIAILTAPTVRFFLRRFAGDQGVDAAAAQRYFVLMLLHFARLPVTILLVIWILPHFIDLHSGFYLDHVLPRMEMVVSEKQSAILALEEEQVDAARRDLTLRELESQFFSKLDTLGRLVPADVDELMTLFLPTFLNIIAWLIIAFLLAWFVFPYLVLRGLFHGVFYAVLLAMAFWMENRLTDQGAKWFGLGKDTFVSDLIVAFLVFANALIFDWLFKFVAEKEKACPHCHALLDKRAMHCADCGMVQPYQDSRRQCRHKVRAAIRRVTSALRQRVQSWRSLRT